MIGDQPNQPDINFSFKKSKIGGQLRSCMHKWFQEFKWIHYSENEDKVYCFYCIKNVHEKKSNAGDKDTFTYSGFNSWNKAKERFKLHESSKEHEDAYFKYVEVPKSLHFLREVP